MESDNQSKLAVIGLGNWGKNFIRTIKDMPAISCPYVVTSKPENKVLLDDNTEILDSYEALLTKNDFDGVIIATPSDTHAKIATEFIKQQRPILIEKPLTLTSSDAQQLLQLAQTHQSLCFVDHIHLFNPAFRQFKHVVKRYGPIQSIITRSGKCINTAQKHSILWELGPHDLAMILDLLSTSPTHISISSSAHDIKHDFSETYTLDLTFPQCKSKTKISNSFHQKTRQFIVKTNTHSLQFQDYVSPCISLWDNHDPADVQVIPISDTQTPLTLLLTEFSTAIKKKQLDFSQLELGYNVVKLLSDCQKQLSSIM